MAVVRIGRIGVEIWIRMDTKNEWRPGRGFFCAKTSQFGISLQPCSNLREIVTGVFA